MFVGTALTGTLVSSAALAENVAYNGAGPYTLTRTDTVAGGPRTIDVTVPNGDITINTATVTVDNPAANPAPTGTLTGVGISANNTGIGATSVTSGVVTASGTGQTTGIDARTTSGALVVKSGTVTTTAVGSTGIIALSSAGGTVDVTADQTIGEKRGIYTSAAGGATTITSGFATASDLTQPNAIIGQGSTVVVNSGNATLTGNGSQGAAIFVQSTVGDATINSTTASTEGYGQLGLDIQYANANGIINSGTITTKGDYAAAIYDSALGNAVITSGTITTAGIGATGIRVSPSRPDANNALPTTGGADITSGTITTTGANADGIVFSAATTYTGETNGSGVSGNAKIVSDTISATGAGSRGIVVAGSTGTVDITSNAITTTGGNGIITNAGATKIASTSVTGAFRGITATSTGTLDITSGTINVANNPGTASNAGGIVASSTGALTITSDSITSGGGNAFGIDARTTGASALTINSTGKITATGVAPTNGTPPIGIVVSAGTGPVTINANAIDASGVAIRSISTGATTINTTGDLISRGGTNTISVTAGSFDITTAAGTTVTSTGGTGAIAGGASTGNGSVTNNGTIAATGTAETGIGITTVGNATVVSNAITVEGASAPSGRFSSGGISAVSSGGGNVSVTSNSVAVNGTGRYGIYGSTTGAGTIDIVSNTASSTSDGFATIRAAGATGAVTIDSTTLTSSAANTSALFASTTTGAVTINSGTLTTTGDGTQGVWAQTTDGNISINAGTTITTATGFSGNTTSDAVFGLSTGNGSVTVVSGTASSAGDYANAVGAVGGGVISVISGTASTSGAHVSTVYASGRNAGAVTINSTNASATGEGAYAVEGHSALGDLTITSGLATAGNGTGIYGKAGGLVTINSATATAAGDGQAGIFAVGGNGVTLVSGTASSTGAIQTYEGAIRRADAIYLEASNGAVNATIGSATATGVGADAVHIVADGTGGAADVAITGTVSAANGIGLSIDPPGAVVVNVASGASVSGSLNGIATTSGSSNTITNNGTIASSTGAGILASGTTALINAGSLSGANGIAVQLGATDDSVTLQSGSNVTGAIAGGGGTDVAILSGTSNTGTAAQTIAAFTGFDSLTVQKGYWTAATTGSSAFNSVAVNSGSSLELTNGGTGVTGISAPTIVDNGTLVVRSSAASAGSTFGATTVGGSGTVLLTGAGTVTLDGTNAITTTGGIVVDSGKLLLTGTQGGNVTTNAGGTFQIGNGGTSGIFTGNLVDNGTLNINHSDTYTVTGALTGSGTIVKDGAGTLVLGSGYAFTGTTTINAGSIKVTTPVATTTELDVEGSGQLDLSGNKQTVAELAGTSSTASVNIAGGSLTVNQATTTTFAGNLTGNGAFTKTGTGSVNFTGVSTYTGPTTVDGGRLAVNGSIVSTVAVNNGGTLGGNGSVGSVTIGAGGTYAPGNSIGRQTVNGNVVFAAGSIYAVEANAAGMADRVDATGSITINGGTVAVNAAAGQYNNLTNYTILTAAGGVTGKFANVTSNLAFLTPFLTYGTGTVTLSLARNDVSFAALARTRNQIGVANAAQALGAGNAIYNAVLVQTTTSAPVTFNQLSGEIYASLPTTLIDSGRRMNDAALSRNGVTGDGVSLWVQGIQAYTTGTRSGYGQLKGNDTGSFGGIDFGMGGWRFGVDGGYTDNRVNVASRTSNAHVKSSYVGGNIGWSDGRAAVQVGGTYAWHDIDVTRQLGVTGLAAAVASSSKANSIQLFGEASYTLVDRRDFTLAPFVRNDYTHTRSDAVTETGGLGALTVARNTRNADFTSAGVKIGGTWLQSDTVTISPHAAVSYRHGWNDLGGDTRSVAFAGTAPAFSITGIQLGRNSIDEEGGVDVAFSQRFTIGASGFGSVSSQLHDYGAKVAASIRF